MGVDGDGVVGDALGSEVVAVDSGADLGGEFLEGEGFGRLQDDDLLAFVGAIANGVL